MISSYSSRVFNSLARSSYFSVYLICSELGALAQSAVCVCGGGVEYTDCISAEG